MEKLNSNTDHLAKFHKEKLGLDTPKNYFDKSKADILKAIPTNNNRRLVFGLKPLLAYPIAASLILMIAISIWMRNSISPIETQITDIEASEINISSDDYLVSSLLIDDSEIESFVDAYILDGIFVKTELSEIELEEAFMNSLFIEDSLIDDYVDDKLLENIIL